MSRTIEDRITTALMYARLIALGTRAPENPVQPFDEDDIKDALNHISVELHEELYWCREALDLLDVLNKPAPARDEREAAERATKAGAR